MYLIFFGIKKLFIFIHIRYWHTKTNCGKILLVTLERCPSGLRSQSWKLVIPQGTVGSNPTLSAMILYLEKYSSGWRGAPAKGVGRLRGARVQIPPSPFGRNRLIRSEYHRNEFEKNLKSSWQTVLNMIDYQSCLMRTAKNLDNWTVKHTSFYLNRIKWVLENSLSKIQRTIERSL